MQKVGDGGEFMGTSGVIGVVGCYAEESADYDTLVYLVTGWSRI